MRALMWILLNLATFLITKMIIGIIKEITKLLTKEGKEEVEDIKEDSNLEVITDKTEADIITRKEETTTITETRENGRTTWATKLRRST